MNHIAVALLICTILLIIVYYTDTGHNLVDKCNTTASNMVDTVQDFFVGNPENMYQETDGDFYNMKAKMTLKKSLAIRPEKRTSKDNFRIGNIYRYYVKNPELANLYYKKALESINLERNNHRAVETNVENVIDRIEDYEELDIGVRQVLPHMRELIMEDRIVRQINNLGEAVIEHPLPPTLQLRNAHAEEVRLNVEPMNMTAKIMGEKNKSEYFKSLQKWTPDPQNVHDSNLTNDVVKTYNMLVKGIGYNIGSGKDMTAISEMKAAIQRLENNKTIARITRINAHKTIDAMSNDLLHSKIGLSEGEIISTIWYRINHDINKSNREELIVSLAENLSDAVGNSGTGTSPVCTAGRVSRALLSFAHLDANPEVGQLKTKEMIRNEVFESASDAYKKFLEESMNGSNDIMKKGAIDSKNGDDTPETALFENVVKEKIKERLETDYSGHITKKDLDLLIKESQAAF